MIAEVQKYDSIPHDLVYEDEDVSVYIEDSTIGWMIHVYTRNWSKGIYLKLINLLVILSEKSPRNEIYCLSNNSKLTKFATMFGFESVDTVLNSNGKELGELLCSTL